MTRIEHYGLGLVTEECGEVLQLVGKAIRFGLDSPESTSPNADTPRTRLTIECGDVLAAVDYCIGKGMFDAREVEQQRKKKLVKLLDKDSKDNLGRRLAP